MCWNEPPGTERNDDTMDSATTVTAAVGTGVLDDFSLEMTGKDVAGLVDARPLLPAGTRVNVTYLGNENLGMRLEAAGAVARSGLVPVPHISARRLLDRQELENYLAGLRAAGAGRDVFVVGGDPSAPHGPYPDALSVLRSGLLREYGVRHVGISGYPEGHPEIPEYAL